MLKKNFGGCALRVNGGNEAAGQNVHIDRAQNRSVRDVTKAPV